MTKRTLILAVVGGYEDLATVIEVEHDFAKNSDMVEAVQEHVIEWLLDTAEGQIAYAESSNDFNWGDLALCLEEIPPSPDFILRDIPHEDTIQVIHDDPFIA